MIVQGTVDVTLTFALAWAWDFTSKFFYVMGKALSDELSCTGIGLVFYQGSKFHMLVGGYTRVHLLIPIYSESYTFLQIDSSSNQNWR